VFNVMAQRRKFLEEDRKKKAPPKGVAVVIAAGAPKGAPPDEEESPDEFEAEGQDDAGAERQERAGVLAAHHQELADHFRQLADGGDAGGESDEEAGDGALGGDDDLGDYGPELDALKAKR
jgi:hypothetical protein